MSVQPAWNLDTTSTSAIQVARGLLYAATTDDVQPLCIMACEQFGNTLAVSPQTLRKIEHSVLPTPQSAVIAFIKGSIGYSRSDCVSYLGKSQAGVQFLALASAITTWPDKFNAAESLHAMLIGTASDKALIPTVRQVKGLLTSIESRCHRSGFMDEVIGWHLLVIRHPALSNYHFTAEPSLPNGEGMANLVDALRQLNRIGSADTTKVVVRPGNSAPWTIAFTNWSLGYPPTITVGRNSVLVLESPKSRVTVNISETDREGFSITTYSSIRGPSELVTPGSDKKATGMTSLENYGQLLLNDRGDVDSDTRAKAFKAALPYALCKIINLVCCDPFLDAMSSRFEPISCQMVSPFRGRGAIRTIYRLLFNEELSLNSINANTDILSLPDVAGTFEDCNCWQCDKRQFDAKECERTIFWALLAGIVKDVLALSLYDCPDRLQVSSQAVHRYYLDTEDLREILIGSRHEDDIRLNPGVLLNRALEITGQDPDQLQKSGWAMSSAMGQAVWLTMYESQSYCRGGYLSLSWHPGLLHHDGEFFNLAVFPSNLGRPGVSDNYAEISNTCIRTPCNLFPNLKLNWNVSKAEDSLCLYLGVRDGPKTHIVQHTTVIDGVDVFRQALIVRYCSHPSTAEMLSSQPGLKITDPIEPQKARSGVNVVPVDGNDALRFLALHALPRLGRINKDYVIMRDKACLDCCLKVCERYRASLMIL